MHQTKIIRSGDSVTFETMLNEFLEEISGHKLVDIKFSTAYNNNAVIHSALIIYLAF